MTSALGCIFALVFGVVFLFFGFLNVVVNAIRSLFFPESMRPRPGFTGDATRPNGGNDTRTGESAQRNASRGKQQNKIFDKDDGEYVDFEEVK